MMDIVERIKDFTLDGAGYNSEHNCMLLDAISEIESLRAQLSKQQSTPSQSVDEREKVVTQKEVDNLFEDNKESFGFNKYFTAKTWFASLSELQPTSQDVADAERWRHFACNQTAMMLGTELSPFDTNVNWLEECNRMADAAIKGKK